MKEEQYGKPQTLAARYGELKHIRENYKARAENYARVTLPYIMPDTETHTSSEDFQHGWQGFGAQVVNHLSNRIIMTLYPPSRSFFKLEFSSDTKRKLEEEGWESDDLALEMSYVEQDAMTFMDKITPRDLDIKTAKHLIITGNYLQYFPNKDKPAVGIGLDQYVVRRDTHGTLLELIICQKKAFASLPMDVQETIRQDPKNRHIKRTTEVELYTGACICDDGMYKLSQEVLGRKIGTEYRMKEENLPFTVLMWNHIQGEDYGRGLVEDHAGDFHVIQILSEALAKGMVLMADIKYMVKPGSYTDVDHLVSSPTGEYISGNIDDIGVLQLERYADFSPISAVLQDYERRVGEAFMLSRAARRDAERVTAYEIRQDAVDLETSLGGVYSQLSNNWQKPRANRLLKMALSRINKQLSDTGAERDRLRIEDFDPEIITGTEALGRLNELDKVVQFTEMMQMPASWPEAMQQRVDWQKFSNKIAAEINLDIDWLISQEEFREMQAAQQQQQMQMMLAQEAAKGAKGLVEKSTGEG